jgi:Tfp pilus assembly protein FimT
MALVAIITTMAWPALTKPFAGRRIQAAVDAVRSELCVARITAMRTGRTYVFRYMVGGDQYSVAPQDESALPATASGEVSNEAVVSATLPREEKTLPEGITFRVDNTTADDPNSLLHQQADMQEDAGDGWSEPILFYPDGTTSNARLLLVNERNRAIRIMLRGLTGTVTVGDAASE